jgi:hypothetical protein
MQRCVEGEGHATPANVAREPTQLIYCVHARIQKREEVRLTRRSGYAFTFLRFLATAAESAARAAALALRRLKLRVVAAAAPYCIALLTPTQLRMASTNRAAALASAVSDAKMA